MRWKRYTIDIVLLVVLFYTLGLNIRSLNNEWLIALLIVWLVDTFMMLQFAEKRGKR